MNIDDKISQALQAESANLEALLRDDGGLFSRLLPIYRGGMKRWVWLVNAIAVVMAGLMFWSAYEFFTATTGAEQGFWGICLVVTLQLQTGLKNWLFMEMNRSSLLQAIKRVEMLITPTR
jgi:hypothetical protein